MKKNSHERVSRLTSLALLTAIVVVLQIFGSSFRIGTIPFSLVLIPITVGACTLGIGAGAFLGGVFGLICLIAGISGSDPFTALIWSVSPFWTAAICLVKGIACGAAAASVYKLLQKNAVLACVTASVCCPIVNTGIFAVFMLTVFRPVLQELCGGSNAVTYLFITMIGINFLVEFLINCALSAAIVRIVRVVLKRKR